jgi:hypothetical protein
LNVCPAGTNSFLTVPLMSKNMMRMLLTLLVINLPIFGLGDFAFHVWVMISFQNAHLIIARVSVKLFSRFAKNVMLFLCRIHREIAWGQIHASK